jgi:hypothetical protein
MWYNNYMRDFTGKPYRQSKLIATKEQLAMYKQVTQFMNNDTEGLFRHILICHQKEIIKNKKDESKKNKFKGVPAPRESFIHKFFRRYHWEQLEATGIVQRLPYDKDNGICYRYRLNEDWLHRYAEKGADYLLNLSKLHNDDLYDVGSGKTLKKIIKPFRNPFNGEKPLTTEVNVKNGVLWLRDLRRQLNIAEGEELVTLKARYIQALYCFKGILERTTSRDYKSWKFEYCQELIEPDKGCRLYEVGGGLLGMPKELRAIMLTSSTAVNIDAVKCHPTIAHHEMTKLGIDSGLLPYLNNEISDSEYLTAKSIKVSVVATINGAIQAQKLQIKEEMAKFTLHKLVHKDAKAKHQQLPFKVKALQVLLKANMRVAKAVERWIKKLPPAQTSMPITAETFQRLERKHLAELHKNCCNYQHDGALVRAEDMRKVRKLLCDKEAVIKLELKQISDETNSELRSLVLRLEAQEREMETESLSAKNTVSDENNKLNTLCGQLISL